MLVGLLSALLTWEVFPGNELSIFLSHVFLSFLCVDLPFHQLWV